jgi:hypothetical protein
MKQLMVLWQLLTTLCYAVVDRGTVQVQVARLSLVLSDLDFVLCQVPSRICVMRAYCV